jgi:hypothetical protein
MIFRVKNSRSTEIIENPPVDPSRFRLEKLRKLAAIVGRSLEILERGECEKG